MKKIIIAIDGHSSTGKSTVAKKLAKEIGYIYIDSGAMYRAITFFAIENTLFDINGDLIISKMIPSLSNIKIDFRVNPVSKENEIYLNDKNISKEIRTMRVSSKVSEVARHSPVRKKLVDFQRKMGENKGLVMDGRDIGSVVFPNAELKIFMTASSEIRAKRRYDELIERGEEVDFDKVHKNVVERDRIDSTRKDSPLIQTNDAVLIDNTNLSRDEQFKRIVDLVYKKINS